MKNRGTWPDSLLDWYARSARVLPWRTRPVGKSGVSRPDPYKVWLSEIMLQQTTVATVTPYFLKFTERWPDVFSLASAELDSVLAAWAGLGYYARARNLHRCAQVISRQHGGRFPEDEAALRALPGVGAYTAAAIAAIAFDKRAVVIDGNVERVMARLHRIETPLPDAKSEIRAAAEALTPDGAPGDYAQALMDLGATVCTPRNPDCGACPWRSPCLARRDGVAELLPRKRPKPEKPVRLGVAYLALDARGRVLLRRRPEQGLLGGMLGLPGTEWREQAPSAGEVDAARPFSAGWRDLEAEARHTFTHFHLRLRLLGARARRPKARAEDIWLARDRLDEAALPTLMKKALRLGLDRLDAD